LITLRAIEAHFACCSNFSLIARLDTSKLHSFDY